MTQSEPEYPLPFFYAAVQRGYPRDRLYRVYLNESMLAGAYIAGQVREDLAIWEAIGRQQRSFWWLVLPVIRRIILLRTEREAFYDAVDPYADHFLDLDRRNFQVARTRILRLRFQYKHLRHVIGSVGILRIETFEGQSHRLVVMGNVDPAALIERLLLLDRATEVTGSDPYRSPHERRVAHAARDLSVAGLLAIGIGVAATTVWALGLCDDWQLPKVAIVGLVIGVGAVLEARKISAAAKPVTRTEA